jgi:hypothetical protein
MPIPGYILDPFLLSGGLGQWSRDKLFRKSQENSQILFHSRAQDTLGCFFHSHSHSQQWSCKYMSDACRQIPGAGLVQNKGSAGEDTSGQIQRESGLQGMMKKLDTGDSGSARMGVECKGPYMTEVVVQCRQVEEMGRPAADALHGLMKWHMLLEPR